MWPNEPTHYGRVEYKREPIRNAGEGTSYFVATPAGLLLGRAYSVVTTARPKWYAEGWTPETDGWEFGPFPARWECFTALLGVERRGISERRSYEQTGYARNRAASDERLRPRRRAA